MNEKIPFITPSSPFKWSKEEVLNDYRMAFRSRLCSLIGRKEVLTGKASFGIFGDGIELPQIALAKSFKCGDFRSGYYRDQTMEFMTGNSDVFKFFSQLYADTNPKHDPASCGRQMNNHFATRLMSDDGKTWFDQLQTKNTSSDISPTAGQMNRALGLAYASKLYRNIPELEPHQNKFSNHGDEVVFATIGDASTSEGPFFEVLNAAGVLQVPLVISVWDNEFGISVPRKLQTTNDSISKAISGFAHSKKHQGIYLYQVKAWDYVELCKTYFDAVHKARTEHKPVLIHVIEVTQPQGHSTSGSHERYKTKERLEWEKEYCCIAQFKKWIVKHKVCSKDDIEKIEEQEKIYVEQERKKSWNAYLEPIEATRNKVVTFVEHHPSAQNQSVQEIITQLKNPVALYKRVIMTNLFKLLLLYKELNVAPDFVSQVYSLYQELKCFYTGEYQSHLYNDSDLDILKQDAITPIYTSNSLTVDGRQILLNCFDKIFARDPRVFVIGEDVGKLGDVNLVFEGLQNKYGELRLTDTGIRESSILGQGIGAAIRGLRPIVDIQYLDYFLYALQSASDDLSTIFYRTKGGQCAPVIMRTKGHRLEGIWHTGSPMSVLLGALRGMYICVPRNMTQAAGMYNVLFKCQNPALVIEVLNGYRIKEILPDNIESFTVPLGVPEVLKQGQNLTIVTYGACVRVALEAAQKLEHINIFAEVIDVQTLLPFDTHHVIKKSIQKTHAVLFLDEDVPGGASAFMMQQVIEGQKAFDELDTAPRTLCASASRVAYGRDGDYFGKPQVEDVYEKCLEIMADINPKHRFI